MDSSVPGNAHALGTRPPRWLIPVLLAAYALFVLAPFLLAPSGVGEGLGFWRRFANGLGMAGFAVLLAEFLLSGRFRTITNPVGIDMTLRLHQLMGHTVLVLLLLHPYLYAVAGPATGPGVDPYTMDLVAGLTGVVAWLAVFAVVVLAIARDQIGLPYETWRLSHGLGAAIAAVFGLHHTLAGGAYTAASPALTAFWVVAVAAAVATLIHVYVLVPLRQGRAPWRIEDVQRIGPGYWDVTLAPEERGLASTFRFLAGQFAWLKVRPSPFSLREHPFSIASSPSALPYLTFTIKEAGDFTRRIGELERGQRAYVNGPHGHFVVDRTAADEQRTDGFVLVAGGVGIAPVISLLRDLRARGEQRPVLLIYATRTLAEALFTEELAAAHREMDLTVIHVVDEPEADEDVVRGPLTPETLRRCLPEGEGSRREHYVCGPPGMIDTVERALEHFGVPLERIHSERFRYSYSPRTPRARRMLATWLLLSLLFLLGALGLGLGYV